MLETMKIAYRNLKKRKVRTILTVVAVSFGVSILIGVNMGSDMIYSSLEKTLTGNLGKIDIMVRVEGGTESYQDVNATLTTSDISNVESWVPRLRTWHYDIIPDKVNATEWGNRLNGILVGLDTALTREKDFGYCKVMNVSDDFSSDLIGKKMSPDYFLKNSNNITRPVVLTKRFMEYNDMGDNITVGEILRIENRYWNPEFPNSTWHDHHTWPDFTVVAIVEDLGKMGSDSLEIWSNYILFFELDDLWDYVANNPAEIDPISHIMVHVANDAPLQEVEEDLKLYLESGTMGNYHMETPKADILEAIIPSTNIIRIAFSIFAGIALIVCGVLIKNLFETAKQTDIHEIGILKGIGFTHRFITRVYLIQVLIISTLGIALSFVIGTSFSYVFLKVLSGSDIAKEMLDITFKIDIAFSISPMTVGIGFLVGYSIPLLFGLIPILQTARVSVVQAIQSGRKSRKSPKKKSIAVSITLLAVGLSLCVAGSFMVNRGIDILLGETVVSTNEVMIPGAFIVGGIIAFLFGVILVGIFALPALAKGLSFIFLIPLERSLKRICYRNLMRNKRRTINTFLMIAIGLSFSVSITTITNSISEGTYPGSKTILGGDIQLHPGIYMDQEFTRDLKELSHIQESCLYRASLDTERIFYLGMGDVFGNKVDDYGYYKDYDYYSHNRYFSLGIVNGTAYYNINDDAILKLKETGHLSKETVFSRLDSIPSIILQDELEGRLDKEVGDNVTLKMEGTSMNLTIIGYADVLPGLPWTYGMNAFGGYYTNPSETDLCGMISWNTYFTMVEQLFNNMDLVVKNRFWQEGLEYTGGPGDKYWGIFGFPMNQTLVRDLLSEYLNNGTISSLGCQTTNFIPIATEYYNERPFNYHEDQNQMSEHLFSSAWRTLNSSLLAIDTSSGDEFGKPLIKKVNASVPESNRSSVESILAWFDTQDSVNACIVNELLVEKSVDDIFDLLDRDDLYSIYQFDIGDEVRVPVNGTIVTYTVVATVESNWNYQYQSLLGNHSSPWIMNSKTMNFDAYKINELYPSLIDLFYMDSNTVMLSNTEFSKLFEGILDDIESLDDQEILPGLNLSALTLLNETMAYNGSEGDHSNLIHINLAPGINASRIQADLEMIFQGIPELENFTIFNPKKYFFEFTNYDKGIGFLGCKREDLEVGVTQIEQLFATRGLYFEDYMVDYYGKETYYFNYFVMLESLLDVITTVFNMVLAFAIAVSLVGLSISMLISMHQRRREIGTLRSVGFSKKDVLILIYGENMTLGVLGIVIGLFAGLFTANIMISQVPFTIFLPILFSPPISTYVINVLIIFGISLTASIIPAYRSMKMDIADVLKSPE